jgi:uncharacterized protein YxeA
MEKKNRVAIVLMLLALVVIGGGIYYLYKERETETPNEITQESTDTAETETEQGEENDLPYTLKLDYEYKGKNIWEYKITGTLSNPCYKMEVETNISKSDPKQAMVKAMITPPPIDEVCAQVVEEVNEKGEFSAGENTVVFFDTEMVYPSPEQLQ